MAIETDEHATHSSYLEPLGGSTFTAEPAELLNLCGAQHATAK